MRKVVVGLMLIGLVFPVVPSVSADTGCPGGAVACCDLPAGTVTCNVAGACTLGTTKKVHGHAGGLGLASVAMYCAFGSDIELLGASCTATGECEVVSANSIGGNMRCVKATSGGTGYCAIFA
jgi:hypothetical protein